MFAAPSATAVEMANWLQRFLILLGLVLATAVHTDGQALQRSLAAKQRPTAPMTATGLHVAASSSANSVPAKPLAMDFSVRDFVREQNAEQNAGHDNNLETLSSSLFRTTRTPFMTRSRVPLAHLPGSRLQINFDATSTINRNLMRGPLVPVQTTEQEFAQGRTDDRYGVSLSVPLGRGGAESGASNGLFAGIARAFRQRK
jgi:hypothetical protein